MKWIGALLSCLLVAGGQAQTWPAQPTGVHIQWAAPGVQLPGNDMAITVTALDSGTFTSSPGTTASISLDAGEMVVVDVATANSSSFQDHTVTVTGSGLTFGLLTGAKVEWGYRRYIQRHYAVASGSFSGTLSIEVVTGGGTWQEAIYSVHKISGFDTGTPWGTVYTNATPSTPAGRATSLSVTVSDTPDSGDIVDAAFGIEGASVSSTLNGELDTTIHNVGGGGNVRTLHTAYDSAPDSNPTPGVTWTGDSYAGGYAVVCNVGDAGTTLEVSGLTHSQALDTPTLTQNHLLVIADATSGQVLDTVAIGQNHVLVVQDAESWQVLDTVAIAQNVVLTIEELTHDQQLAGVAIGQNHLLVVQDAESGQVLESIPIGQNHVLIVGGLEHGQTVDHVELATGLVIDVQSLTHAQALDQVAVSVNHMLAVLGLDHAQSLDAPQLLQLHVLAADGLQHAHALDAPTLDIGLVLQVQSLLHSMALDGVDLEQVHVLVVDDVTHSHLLDAVTLSGGEYTLPTERMIHVEPESRIITVARDDRMVLVVPENRRVTIQ